MESLKQPAMILSILNSLAVLSSIIYFYRKTNELTNNISVMSGVMKKMIEDMQGKKIMEKMDEFESIVKLQKKQLNTNRTIAEKIGTTEDEIEDLWEKVLLIIKTLNEKGMEVKIKEEPQQPQYRKQRGGARKQQPRRKNVRFEDEEDDKEEDDEEEDDKKTDIDRMIAAGRNRRR